MGQLATFQDEARDLDRRLGFLWVATAVAVASLLLARGSALLVWSGVLLLCVLGLLVARHSYLRLARKIEELPPGARQKARRLVMRRGRFLFLRLGGGR